LNKGSESEQPAGTVDLRDDGVDIDLPSREEIEGAVKYLKNNKAAGGRGFYRGKSVKKRWTLSGGCLT
jgi:hypothetical protein